MSSRLKFWCIVLMLPVFGAITHDAYHSYFSTQEKQRKVQALQINPKSYQVSDFGYMILTYLPEVYESARKATGEQNWQKWVEPVLKQYTVVVLLIPNVLLWIYLGLARVVGLPPFRFVMDEQETSRKRDPLDKRTRSNTMKYNRR